MKILKDCYCERSLNEISKHYRSGTKIKKLQSGDDVEFVKEFSNCYGNFITVIRDGIEYDIKPENILKPFTV